MKLLKSLNKITPDLLVTDIVASNYHSAEIFRKYNIDFCCGGKVPVTVACTLRGLNENSVLEDLNHFADHDQNPREWPIDFMIDYLINIHHNYFKYNIPVVEEYTNRFAASHLQKFPGKKDLPLLVSHLCNSLASLVSYEKDTLFQYIKKIILVSEKNDGGRELYIKILNKFSKEDILQYKQIEECMLEIRHVTDDFQIPEKACLTHKVMLFKLQEFTNYIAHHFYIEDKILIPAVLKLEIGL